MAKIDVCGVAHIDPETEKVSGYLNERIDEGALVFLEPTLEMLTDPSTEIFAKDFQKNL